MGAEKNQEQPVIQWSEVVGTDPQAVQRHLEEKEKEQKKRLAITIGIAVGVVLLFSGLAAGAVLLAGALDKPEELAKEYFEVAVPFRADMSKRAIYQQKDDESVNITVVELRQAKDTEADCGEVCDDWMPVLAWKLAVGDKVYDGKYNGEKYSDNSWSEGGIGIIVEDTDFKSYVSFVVTRDGYYNAQVEPGEKFTLNRYQKARLVDGRAELTLVNATETSVQYNFVVGGKKATLWSEYKVILLGRESGAATFEIRVNVFKTVKIGEVFEIDKYDRVRLDSDDKFLLSVDYASSYSTKGFYYDLMLGDQVYKSYRQEATLYNVVVESEHPEVRLKIVKAKVPEVKLNKEYKILLGGLVYFKAGGFYIGFNETQYTPNKNSLRLMKDLYAGYGADGWKGIVVDAGTSYEYGDYLVRVVKTNAKKDVTFVVEKIPVEPVLQ